MADFWALVKKAKEIYSWYSFAAGGVALAIGGVVWLVTHGIPWPLAAMAAYCTVSAAIVVAVIPNLLSRTSNVPHVQISKPNYSIWRHRTEYHLYEVAYLLAGSDPIRAPEMMNGEAAAWFNLLSEAISKDELQRIRIPLDDSANIFMGSGYRPHFDTRIDAAELSKFCKERGISQQFLRR